MRRRRHYGRRAARYARREGTQRLSGLESVGPVNLDVDTFEPDTLKRVFVKPRRYKRNPVEVRFDANNVPYVVFRNKKTYTKIPSSYSPATSPSMVIPMRGALKTKNRLLRRMVALSAVTGRARALGARRTLKVLRRDLKKTFSKYKTYRVKEGDFRKPTYDEGEQLAERTLRQHAAGDG